MTVITNVTMTRNTLKKYNDFLTTRKELDAQYEMIAADRRALIADKPASEAFAIIKASPEYAAIKAREDDNYKARKDNDVLFERFKKRYLKAPVMPVDDVRRNGFKITLDHPRDGMGKLKLWSNNLDHAVTRSGCGYAKLGAAFGDWLEETFNDVLQTLNPIQIANFYGINQYKHNGGKVTLDGACGERCMYELIEWLGYEVRELYDLSPKRNGTIGYVITYVGSK